MHETNEKRAKKVIPQVPTSIDREADSQTVGQFLVTPRLDDLIEAFPVVRKLRLPLGHAWRRSARRHCKRHLLHVLLANDHPGEKFRVRRQMQRGSSADAMRERIHQLSERNRVAVGCVQNLSRVRGPGGSEQRGSGIELVEVVLPRAAAGPVRPAEMKRGAIGA